MLWPAMCVQSERESRELLANRQEGERRIYGRGWVVEELTKAGLVHTGVSWDVTDHPLTEDDLLRQEVQRVVAWGSLYKHVMIFCVDKEGPLRIPETVNKFQELLRAGLGRDIEVMVIPTGESTLNRADMHLASAFLCALRLVGEDPIAQAAGILRGWFLKALKWVFEDGPFGVNRTLPSTISEAQTQMMMNDLKPRSILRDAFAGRARPIMLRGRISGPRLHRPSAKDTGRGKRAAGHGPSWRHGRLRGQSSRARELMGHHWHGPGG